MMSKFKTVLAAHNAFLVILNYFLNYLHKTFGVIKTRKLSARDVTNRLFVDDKKRIESKHHYCSRRKSVNPEVKDNPPPPSPPKIMAMKFAHYQRFPTKKSNLK